MEAYCSTDGWRRIAALTGIERIADCGLHIGHFAMQVHQLALPDAAVTWCLAVRHKLFKSWNKCGPHQPRG
eukprot:106826-Alexandrium_andersonii.AAC.1